MGDTQRNVSQNMFLLEVLVNKVVLSHSSLNLDHRLKANLTDTCVLFQFLHYPPMVVCESDFIGDLAGQTDTNHITFQSGKSCCFSLKTPQRPVLPVPLDIKVSVIRKLKEGVLPNKLEIGKTNIDMGDSFTELLSLDTDENCDKLPVSKSKKGTFELKDESGRAVGSLTAYIRLSCFGKLIITQFSLSKEDEKSYLFKGTDATQFCHDKGFRDFENISSGTTKDKYFCSVNDNKELSLLNRPVPEDLNMYNVVKENEVNALRPCGCPATNNVFPQISTFKTFPSASIPFPYYAPPTTTPFSTLPLTPQPFSSLTQKGMRGNLCDCPYPVPPSVMSKYTQRKERGLDLAPGEVGIQDDQVIFQLPLKKHGEPSTDRDKQIDSSVFYKLTSAEETNEGLQKNTVQVKSDDLPGMACKGAVGQVSGLPVDDKHDVFLLKIGKKCDGDKKRNLELELRTPKMKEPKPPMTDQNTQYLESDVPKDAPIKTPRKGTGEKGKKGKKGGKKGKK